MKSLLTILGLIFSIQANADAKTKMCGIDSDSSVSLVMAFGKLAQTVTRQYDVHITLLGCNNSAALKKDSTWSKIEENGIPQVFTNVEIVTLFFESSSKTHYEFSLAGPDDPFRVAWAKVNRKTGHVELFEI